MCVSSWLDLLLKGKAIPLQTWTGPEGSSRLRLPRFQDIRHVKVVRSVLRTGRLYPPSKYFWYSFLLGAESTPGPQCGRKDYVDEKLQWHHRGIEPATFRLVAQCLNQLRYRINIWYHRICIWCESKKKKVSFVVYSDQNCVSNLHFGLFFKDLF